MKCTGHWLLYCCFALKTDTLFHGVDGDHKLFIVFQPKKSVETKIKCSSNKTEGKKYETKRFVPFVVVVFSLCRSLFDLENRLNAKLIAFGLLGGDGEKSVSLLLHWYIDRAEGHANISLSSDDCTLRLARER